jgi:tRNA threonylcarbamoyladenosine biosynthesis protein TsaB
MLILSIRTDNPDAEIGLFEGDKQIAYEVWPAHRQLAETIHKKLQALLQSQAKNMEDLDGVVAFQGPGSFTGLRIGLTVANTIAYALNIPIKGVMGDDWIALGTKALAENNADPLALPEYGAEAHITQQKK